MKPKLVLSWIAILLANPLDATAVDIGLIVGKPEAATANTERWNSAYAANPPKSVTLPVGTVYINGPIKTRRVTGCGRINTDGAYGYALDGNPALTGAMCRVVQLAKGQPVLRLSGAGFYAVDPMEFVGDGASSAIEVEGCFSLATGEHRFGNIIFRNWGCAFDALAGHYKDGKFVADENHADNCTVNGCGTFNVGTFFRSRNQQAVQWAFRDCVVNFLGGPNDQIVADLVRGGNITFDSLMINHPRVTLFRVRDYSPNNCNLVCRDFRYDRPLAKDPYVTLFEYTGDPKAAASYKWDVRISGFIAAHFTKFEPQRLYKVPENLPRDGWDIRVNISGELQ